MTVAGTHALAGLPAARSMAPRSLDRLRGALGVAVSLRLRPSEDGRGDSAGGAAALQQACLRICQDHDLKVQVRGDWPAPPFVVVCNHTSYLDPLVILSLTPCLPIAKQEVLRWPLIGPAVERAGVMFVKRGHVHSGARVLRAGLRALEDQTSILGFPEGTTTHGETVLPFFRGLFGLAKRAQVPIVPVRLDYDDRALTWVGDAGFVPHYLRWLKAPGSWARVTIGRPTYPEPDHDPAELARRARELVRVFGLK